MNIRKLVANSIFTRIFIICLLAMAYWSPEIFYKESAINMTILVDNSLSIDAKAMPQHWQNIYNTIGTLPADSTIKIIAFAKNATEVTNLKAGDPAISNYRTMGFLEKISTLDLSGTNIESALRKAGPNRSNQESAMIVILTDGGQTHGSVDNYIDTSEVNSNIYFGYIEKSKPLANAFITRVDAPSRTNPNQTVPITIQVYSKIKTTGQLTIKVNGDSVHRIPVELKKNQITPVRIWQKMTAERLANVEVSLQTFNSPVPSNQVKNILININSPPKVAYISKSSSAPPFLKALQKDNINTLKISPNYFMQHQDTIRNGSIMVLDNISVGDMPEKSWQLLINMVRNNGIGLIVLGGPDTFSGGTYRHSTLESILPVTAESNKPEYKTSVIFVVDKSGSMGQGKDDNNRLSLARLAAIETSRSLIPQDTLGLLAFDIKPHLLLPINNYSEPYNALANAWTISASGGTQLKPALTEAINLIDQINDSKQKLLILITDGFVESKNFETLAEDIAKKGITVLAIAIGEEANLSALKLITNHNNGKILKVNKLANLPFLMRREIDQQRHKSLDGLTTPIVVKQSPLNINLEQPPEVSAYMTTKAREQANVYWKSDNGAPLLVSHNSGAGRVIVLPAGLSGWAKQWPEWSNWNHFSRGLIQWAHGQNSSDFLTLMLDETGINTYLIVEALDQQYDWSNYQDLQLRMRDPLDNTYDILPHYVAPGRYSAKLPLQYPGQHQLIATTVNHSIQHSFIYDEKSEHLEATNGAKNIEKWLKKDNVKLWTENNFSLLRETTKKPINSRSPFILLAIFTYIAIMVYENKSIFNTLRIFLLNRIKSLRYLIIKTMHRGTSK